MLFNIIFKQYLNIFIRNFVLCIQIRFVSTEKTTRIASRASCFQMVCIVYYLYYKLLYEIGLGDVWEADAKCVNHSLLIQQFEQWLKNAFIQSCVSNMETSNRCLLYRTLCREFSMASYLYKIHIPANRKAMTKFRLSSHKLMVERGSWLRVPRTDR